MLSGRGNEGDAKRRLGCTRMAEDDAPGIPQPSKHELQEWLPALGLNRISTVFHDLTCGWFDDGDSTACGKIICFCRSLGRGLCRTADGYLRASTDGVLCRTRDGGLDGDQAWVSCSFGLDPKGLGVAHPIRTDLSSLVGDTGRSSNFRDGP